MEVRELLKEAIETTKEQIDKMPDEWTRDKKEANDIFCRLVELYNQGTKIEYEEYAAEQRIDAENKKNAEEIKLKLEQWQAERKRSWIPSPDAILLTVVFSLMTLILYVIEGKGVIAPKAARTLEKLLRFVRIG